MSAVIVNAGSTPVFTASIRVTLRTSNPAPDSRMTARRDFDD